MPAGPSNLDADADCLGLIHRLATRLVKGFRRLPYEERLYRLGLHSSHRRQHRGDLITTYEVFFGGLDLDPRLFFIPSVRPIILQSPAGLLVGRSHAFQYESLNI